jgi:hypothetical protein
MRAVLSGTMSVVVHPAALISAHIPRAVRFKLSNAVKHLLEARMMKGSCAVGHAMCAHIIQYTSVHITNGTCTCLI